MSDNRYLIEQLAERRGLGDPDQFVERLDAAISATASFRRETGHSLALRAVGPALLVLGIVAVGITLWRFGPASDQAPTAGGVMVAYERSDVELSYTLSCPDGSGNAMFSGEATIEIWADWEGDRSAQRSTFGDASVHEMVVVGHHPQGPSQAFERGVMPVLPGANCASGDIPGYGFPPYSLNLVMLDPGRPDDLEAWIPWGYDDAEAVAGSHTDSLGRQAVLYRVVWVDHVVLDPDSPEEEWPSIRIVRSWYVHPDDGGILEIVVEHSAEGALELDYRRVLVASQNVPVADSVFAVDDFEILWLDGVRPDDPDTAMGVEVDSTLALGDDWLWPASPVVADPVDLAERFASEVLGWAPVTVTFLRDPFGSVDPVEYLIEGTQGAGVRLFLDSDSGNVSNVGEPGAILLGSSAAMARVEFLPVVGTKRIEVVVSTGSDTRTWDAEADGTTTSVFLPGLKNREILTILVRYLDERGMAIDAIGGSFVAEGTG